MGGEVKVTDTRVLYNYARVKGEHMIPKELQEWYNSRPKCIKKLIDKCPMDGTYTMTKTGKDYYKIYSYNESGTLKVIRFNHHTNKKMWLVFGVKPTDLILKEAKDENT